MKITPWTKSLSMWTSRRTVLWRERSSRRSVQSELERDPRVDGTDLGRAFKEGDFVKALEKYQKALRYLDQNPVLPNDADKSLVDTYRKL